jgi:hypothetical protein
MYRKDFIALAKAIGGIVDNNERQRMTTLIGEVYQSHNPNFNWKK